MLTISEDALALIATKKSPLLIGVPHAVRSCCFDMTECPSVGFGEPPNGTGYTKQTIQGVEVYVPDVIADNDALVVRVRNVLGFKQLVIDGWALI
jgi:hypothetical protein